MSDTSITVIYHAMSLTVLYQQSKCQSNIDMQYQIYNNLLFHLFHSIIDSFMSPRKGNQI